jgi:hypothetical protein
MVDKNRNGIDDSKEGFAVVGFGGKPKAQPASPTRPAAPSTGAAKAWQDFLQGPVRGVSNFAGDLGLWLTSQPIVKGNSAGDQMFGVPERRAAAGAGRNMARVSTKTPVAPSVDPVTNPSLLDFLSQAEGLVDQLGIGGGGGGPDYSGAMSSARQEAANNRQHLAGIYGQLRSGLENDRAGIAQNYGGAIDRSQEIAQEAQSTTRAAYDAAQARQDQAANALGMQAAAASQQLDRPTTQQQAADAIADSAARAQNAQTQYNTNQTSATTHSQNVQDASRYSEARAQGALDQSLSDRIAELSQLQAQSQASGQGQRGSAILSLAQSLYGDAQGQSQQNFENRLAYDEMLAGAQQAPPSYTLAQLMQGQADSGLNTQDYLSFMKLLNSLNG